MLCFFSGKINLTMKFKMVYLSWQNTVTVKMFKFYFCVLLDYLSSLASAIKIILHLSFPKPILLGY